MITPTGQGLHDRRRRCDKCKERRPMKGGRVSGDGRKFTCKDCI